MKISLIVFDECHWATKNYAYNIVYKKMIAKNRNFWVLALSASPGKNINDVQEIIKVLGIGSLEIWWKNDLDI